MKKWLFPNQGMKRFMIFVIGIVATIAYRAIIVLEGQMVRVAWYTGTIGFILYFGHRSNVQKKRRNLVIENDLVNFVDKARGLSKKKKAALHYLISTSATSRAHMNSFVIFLLSVLALVVGLVRDLMM